MEFKKIKITKEGGIEVLYKTYVRAGDIQYSTETTVISTMPPHQDLFDAFEKLNFYLADLCEQRDCVLESVMRVTASAEIEESDTTSQIECRGVSLGVSLGAMTNTAALRW